jgi:hypothetical protein
MGVAAKLASSPSETTCPPISLISDPNFYTNISQTILSLLSIYLMIIPVIRSRTLGLQYRSWFWACLAVSSVTSILGVSLSGQFPMASGMLGWIGTFAQVVITMLVTQSIRSASKEGSLPA